MAGNKGRFWASRPARLLAAALALAVWQLAAALVDNRLLLVGPVRTLAKLCALLPQAEFWSALGFTLSRVALGFLLGFLAALLLAAQWVRCRWRRSSSWRCCGSPGGG